MCESTADRALPVHLYLHILCTLDALVNLSVFYVRKWADITISFDVERLELLMFEGEPFAVAQQLEVNELVLSGFQELIADELADTHHLSDLLTASAWVVVVWFSRIGSFVVLCVCVRVLLRLL